jgi:hypothetical protein
LPHFRVILQPFRQPFDQGDRTGETFIGKQLLQGSVNVVLDLAIEI